MFERATLVYRLHIPGPFTLRKLINISKYCEIQLHVWISRFVTYKRHKSHKNMQNAKNANWQKSRKSVNLHKPRKKNCEKIVALTKIAKKKPLICINREKNNRDKSHKKYEKRKKRELTKNREKVWICINRGKKLWKNRGVAKNILFYSSNDNKSGTVPLKSAQLDSLFMQETCKDLKKNKTCNKIFLFLTPAQSSPLWRR